MPGPRSELAGSARKMALDRELDQPHQIANIELPHEPCAVGVYRLGADIEQVGDVLGAKAVYQVREDLRFARAERRQWILGGNGAFGAGEQAHPSQQGRYVNAAVLHEVD